MSRFSILKGPAAPPNYIPDVTRLMQVKNEYFCAGAIWKRTDGLWACAEAAPIIKWMLRCDPAKAKLECARRGLSVEWI